MCLVHVQDIQTKQGKTYTLKFDMRCRGQNCHTDDEAVSVMWRGQSLGKFHAPRVNTWKTHTIRVTGSGGKDRLTFREVNSSDGSGPLIDDISLQES